MTASDAALIVRNHIPDRRFELSVSECDADIHSAKQVDRLPDFLQILDCGIGVGQQCVTGQSIALEVVQNVEFNAPGISARISGIVSAPLLVSAENVGIGDREFDSYRIHAPRLTGMTKTGNRAIA